MKNLQEAMILEKRILWRIVSVLLLALVLVIAEAIPASAQQTWVFYMYVCGSDLETDDGSATNNLAELFKVPLPENVTFFIQTGGASKWHLKGVPSNKIGRFVYDSKGFRELQILPDASMGKKETLTEFLSFAGEHFPADKRMVIFWDHGGGSIGGFCYDEKFEETLSLNDLQYALENSFGKNPSEPPLEMVTFDTCLMATLETANILQGYSKYLTACQELMPGYGTDYQGWVGAVAKDPALEGRQLGQIICDTFMKRCQEYECDEMANMSLVDLGKLPALNAAYEKLGRAALKKASQSPKTFFPGLDRAGNTVESYGVTDEDGINTYNMVDLGSLAEEMDMPEADELQKALSDAVLYRVAGKYRRYGNGLSCYYSLDGDDSALVTYCTLPKVSPSFSRLYSQMLTPDAEGKALYVFDLKKLEDKEVVLEGDTAVLKLTPEDANAISEVECLLTFNKDGKEIVLGTDDKLTKDWAQGIFRDDFQGEWPQLCGHVLPMYMDEAHPDYYLFGSTILLNGKKYYLASAFDVEKQEFEILGARRILKSGQIDRTVMPLKKGDTVTPLFYSADEQEMKGETFTLTEEPYLEDALLPADDYTYYFRLKAPRNEPVLTGGVEFHVEAAEQAQAA